MTKKIARDAPKRRWQVTITREMHDIAKRGDSRACLVRQGVFASIPGIKRLEVTLQWVRFTLGDLRYEYPLTASAAYLLASFESGDDVRPLLPLTFSLRHPKITYAGTKATAGPGTVTAIRLWAIEQGLPVKQTGGLAEDLIAAYESAHPGVEYRPTVRQFRRSRQASDRVRVDRFYGLRLRDGFKPGGEPA
jgi:hypothetical protein